MNHKLINVGRIRMLNHRSKSSPLIIQLKVHCQDSISMQFQNSNPTKNYNVIISKICDMMQVSKSQTKNPYKSWIVKWCLKHKLKEQTKLMYCVSALNVTKKREVRIISWVIVGVSFHVFFQIFLLDPPRGMLLDKLIRLELISW